MRTKAWILLGLLGLAGSCAPREMAVSQWGAGEVGVHPQTVKVTGAGGGASVIQVTLSAAPKGARVLYAHLLIGRSDARPVGEDLLTGGKVQALKAPFQQDRPPQLDRAFLPLTGPDFDRFDATEPVRKWLAQPAKNFGLYVTGLAGWEPDRTALEIAWEGKLDGLPRPVTALNVRHRAGQTFITFKELEDPFGDQPVTWGQIRNHLRQVEAGQRVRYRVYRHDKPIDARSVAQAERVGEVGPLSGFNVNSWSLERLISGVVFANEDLGELAVYGPFEGVTMNSQKGGRLVIRRFVVEEGKRPLPPGTGLFVYSPDRPGASHYAVVPVVGGVANVSDFSAANSLSQAVQEKPGPGEPVCQGSAAGEFGFDFRGERFFYVAWCGPPLSPRQNMYFNWSVLLPPAARGAEGKPDRLLPVELTFHSPGGSYARPGAKYLDDSIQVCPHDFPFSGWYGFNDSYGTLKSFADGVVRNHTQKRILAFVDWVMRKFPADPHRVLAVGGDGAALMALYRPDLFAYVLVPQFEGALLNPKVAGEFTAAWGPKSDRVRDEQGRTEWSWAEPDLLLCGVRMPAVVRPDAQPPTADAKAPGPRMELPLFICRGGSWGRDPAYAHGRGRFYYALQGTHHALWGHWAWGGRLKVPDKFSGLWQGVDIRNDTPLPAITNSSADKEGEGSGNTNDAYSWKDLKDEPDRFTVTVLGPEGTFDLTPRRVMNFKIKPGEKLLCRVEPLPPREGRPASTEPAAPREVVASPDGLAIVTGLSIPRFVPGLTVTLTRGR